MSSKNILENFETNNKSIMYHIKIKLLDTQ
jgi:hypothetical protein